MAPKPKRKTPHQLLLEAARPFYELWLTFQGGKCALCKRPEPDHKRLDLDHDHKTMHIRGLLCWRCNKFLHPWMTPEWLRLAATYVEEGSTVHVGDYVELRKSHDRIRRGTRGEVVTVRNDWAEVLSPDGSSFDAPVFNLSRLVGARAIAGGR